MKYLLYTGGLGMDSPVIGIRYASDKKELMVGGYKTDERLFWETLKTYFEVDTEVKEIVAKFTKRNKIRLILEDIELDVVLRGFCEIEKQGLVLMRVKSFGKLMR